MNQEPAHISECIPDMLQPEKVREVLDRPFDGNAIKTRPGNFGKSLCYVEAPAYIHRLNKAFGPMWSFTIVSHEVLEKEVIVVGKLVTHGFVKMAFGGSQITRVKDTREQVSIADDLKAAATDSFKKACSFLGLGLHLYQDNGENSQKAQGHNASSHPTNGNGNGNGSGANGRLTSRQLEAIISIGRDKGLDRNTLRKMSLDRFGRNLEFIGKGEASTLIQELKRTGGHNGTGGGR